LHSFLFCESSIAGKASYSCAVEHVYAVDDNGSLSLSGFENTLKNGQFMVDRLHGTIVGDVLPTSLAYSTRVIKQGSSSNSFKAIADFGNEFQVIVVKEFHDGLIKPFYSISTGGAEIATGTCK
jgi:hypothetical protein